MKHTRWLFISLLVLCLLPISGMAEDAVLAFAGTCGGYQYLNGDTEITASLADVVDASPELNSLLGDQPRLTFKCEWTPHQVLDHLDDGDTHWGLGRKTFNTGMPTYGYYGLTLGEISTNGLADAPVVVCSILRKDDSSVAAKVTFTLDVDALVHAPTFASDVPEEQQLFFDADQPVQVTFPAAAVGDDAPLYYHFYRQHEDGNTLLAQDLPTPSFSHTPVPAEHGRELVCTVSRVPYGDGIAEWYCPRNYVLQDRSRDAISMPSYDGEEMAFALYRGESRTLAVPAASGTGGQLVYRWHCAYPDGGSKTVESAQPQLTLTFDNVIDGGSYYCSVGYRGQEDSFLDYVGYMYYPIKIDKQREVITATANQKAAPPVSLEAEQGVETITAVPAAGEGVNGEFTNAGDFAQRLTDAYNREIETVQDLKEVMIQSMEKEMPELKMATTATSGQTLYDVELRVDAAPAGAAKPYALLPYPEGARGVQGLTFMVGHLYESDAAGCAMEFVPGIPTEDGIMAFVNGASPMLVQWQKDAPGSGDDAAQPNHGPASVPRTGDDTPLWLLMALLALSGVSAALLMRGKRRGA